MTCLLPFLVKTFPTKLFTCMIFLIVRTGIPSISVERAGLHCGRCIEYRSCPGKPRNKLCGRKQFSDKWLRKDDKRLSWHAFVFMIIWVFWVTESRSVVRLSDIKALQRYEWQRNEFTAPANIFTSLTKIWHEKKNEHRKHAMCDYVRILRPSINWSSGSHLWKLTRKEGDSFDYHAA